MTTTAITDRVTRLSSAEKTKFLQSLISRGIERGIDAYRSGDRVTESEAVQIAHRIIDEIEAERPQSASALWRPSLRESFFWIDGFERVAIGTYAGSGLDHRLTIIDGIYQHREEAERVVHVRQARRKWATLAQRYNALRPSIGWYYFLNRCGSIAKTLRDKAPLEAVLFNSPDDIRSALTHFNQEGYSIDNLAG